MIIPPGASGADPALKVRVAASLDPCQYPPGVIEIEHRGKRARLTVAPENLAKQPRGWLVDWALRLEERNCVPPGEGMNLAVRIVESIPLDPGAAFRLLHLDDNRTGIVDTGPNTRLQVVSPLLREPGLGLMAEGPYAVKAGNGYNLNITGKSTENVIGFETAVFSVERANGGIGYKIAPLYSDRTREGKTERSAHPAVNFFRFPVEAAFYRIFYKSTETGFTALMVAARTPVELGLYTRTLIETGTCEKLARETCIALPRNVAVHPLIAVSVNAVEVLLPRGATVFQSIRRSGETKPESVVPRLSVYKPWKGRLTPVRFDPNDAAILKLGLRGGEVISWR